jgi:2-dehydropantoate 2-reductase
MRTAILGAGAIGSSMGALLARAGHAVTLVGRPEQVAAIRMGGLRVDGPVGTFTVPVRAEALLETRPDLALLAVKTQDVSAVVRTHRAFLEDVPVVTMQNGIQSDAIVAEILPLERLLSTVVQVTATYLSPGHVTLLDRGALVLGRPHGRRDALVEQVAGVLRSAVPVSLSDNLEGAHWLKLIMNLNNAIPAVTNLSLREVTANPFLRRLAIRLMREGVLVAEAQGVELESLAGVPVRTVRLLTRLPAPLAARMFASRAGDLGDGWPVLGSTLQSLRRGKPTEIDYLNGEIVRRGRKLGVKTPANEKVVELVHEVEQTGRFSLPEALERSISPPRGG